MPSMKNNYFTAYLFLTLLPALSVAAGNDSDPYNGQPRTNVDPSIGCIIVVLVCAFFMTGCIATYIGGCAGTTTTPAYGRYLLPVASLRSKPGLARSDIETLPTFVYSDVKNLKIGKRDLECAICLAEFADDETLRLLPKCEHAFHPECIDPWLSVRSTCPVCRSDLTEVELSSPKRGSGCERGELDVAGGEERTIRPDFEGGLAEKMNPRAKFVRSNSTGHSVMIGDRFRLRLPEEVRRQIMAEVSMRRVKSFGALPRVSSSRKGYRIGWDGSSSQSGRLVRWSGFGKSGDGGIAGTSSDAVLVAILVN